MAPRVVPIDVQRAEPRYFGLGPPVFMLSAAAALLVLGAVLIASGSVLLGVIAIALGVCLLPAFLAGARRWPDASIARIGVSTADRIRDEAGVAVTSISTWSRAGRDVARLRKERFQLRRDRDAKIRELGISVYSDDGRADGLKSAAKALDDRMAASDRELQRTVAGARRRTRKGRATVVATEVIKPEAVTEAGAAPSVVVETTSAEQRRQTRSR